MDSKNGPKRDLEALLAPVDTTDWVKQQFSSATWAETDTTVLDKINGIQTDSGTAEPVSEPETPETDLTNAVEMLDYEEGTLTDSELPGRIALAEVILEAETDTSAEPINEDELTGSDESNTAKKTKKDEEYSFEDDIDGNSDEEVKYYEASLYKDKYYLQLRAFVTGESEYLPAFNNTRPPFDVKDVIRAIREELERDKKLTEGAVKRLGQNNRYLATAFVVIDPESASYYRDLGMAPLHMRYVPQLSKLNKNK